MKLERYNGLRRTKSFSRSTGRFSFSAKSIAFVILCRVALTHFQRLPNEDNVAQYGERLQEYLRDRHAMITDTEKATHTISKSASKMASWKAASREVRVAFRDEELAVRFTRLPRTLSPRCNARVIFLILSAAENFEESDIQRTAIRATWAAAADSVAIQRGDAKLFFMIGHDEAVRLKVDHEADRHGDLILIDTLDTYASLVYKSIAALHVGTALCTSKLLVKADDDTVLHVDRIVAASGTWMKTDEAVAYCAIHVNTRVERLETNKWFVSPSDFEHPIFPPYCYGPAYVLTKLAAIRILEGTAEVALRLPEDALLTGVVALARDVRLHEPRGRFALHPYTVGYQIDEREARMAIASSDHKTPYEVRHTWNAMKSASIKMEEEEEGGEREGDYEETIKEK